MMESLAVKASLVLFFWNTYVLGEYFSSVCHQNVESTCSQEGFSTTWNKKNVGKHLKQWIQSVSISQQKDDLKGNLHGSKYVQILKKEDDDDVLTMIANAECKNGRISGKPLGKVWKIPNTHSQQQFRDGFFYGALDTIDGRFSGDDVAFIFPDMKTVLVGKFREGYMVAGRESKIIAERCNNGIKEVLFAPADVKSAVFRYKRPNAWSMGYDYTLIDPYERRTTYIDKSRFDGEGVFAKRNIKTGELVSYYNGIIHNYHGDNKNDTEEEV